MAGLNIDPPNVTPQSPHPDPFTAMSWLNDMLAKAQEEALKNVQGGTIPARVGIQVPNICDGVRDPSTNLLMLCSKCRKLIMSRDSAQAFLYRFCTETGLEPRLVLAFVFAHTVYYGSMDMTPRIPTFKFIYGLSDKLAREQGLPFYAFVSAYANDIRDYLNKSPETEPTLFVFLRDHVTGLGPVFRDLSFDCSFACTGLTQEQFQFVNITYAFGSIANAHR